MTDETIKVLRMSLLTVIRQLQADAKVRTFRGTLMTQIAARVDRQPFKRKTRIKLATLGYCMTEEINVLLTSFST